MSKTIKEIADELGVSKTAIRNKMTDDFRKKGANPNYHRRGVDALKSIFRSGNHTANFIKNQFAPNEDFKAELKAKNEQIEKLQQLLDQSQQLLLSEQKKSQLLIESKKETVKFDDYFAEQLKNDDFKQVFFKRERETRKASCFVSNNF